jgi:uncharacterized protein (TIGR01777 family)
MRVLVSGATGLIGAPLGARLAAAGHGVVPLVRRRGAAGVYYDPARGEIDHAALAAARIDAAVHLGGAGVADRRWTAERKREIRDSRTAGTGLIAAALAALEPRPRVLVSASAVGFYGVRPPELREPLDEDAPPGDDFLAEVCVAWEAAADPARAAGLRVAHPRFGVVLARDGGALARMLPPFRLGAGGPVGSGRQVMSWIALPDAVESIVFALENDALRGPFNATAPNPVTNAEFARTLGRVLGRPAVLPVPATVISLLFGEMGRVLLLGGQRVVPARLAAAGFRFRQPALEGALASLLG